MFDLSTLHELSRCHCLAICAVLVPANLLMSTAVVSLTIGNRSMVLRQWLSIGGAICGGLLLAHVWSWWLIGVVAPATFVLPSLGLLCTTINWVCLNYPIFAGHFWRSVTILANKSSHVRHSQ